MGNRYFKTRDFIFGRVTLSYYHFAGGYAARQIEISTTEIYMMTDKTEIAEGSLSEFNFSPDDCITAEEFEEAWNSPLKVQKELALELQSDINSEEKFIGFEFIESGKGTTGIYHFIGENVVRMIEITEDSIYLKKDKSSLKLKLKGNLLSRTIDESSLKSSKLKFSDVKIPPHFFMTAEEFDDVWNSPRRYQKRRYGSNAVNSDTKADEKFVRIELVIWRKKTVGYYHFVGGYAVRLLEITKTEIYMMSNKYSLKVKLDGNLFSKVAEDLSIKITDDSFYNIELLQQNFITAEEFNSAWDSPKEVQKKVFGKIAGSPD